MTGLSSVQDHTSQNLNENTPFPLLEIQAYKNYHEQKDVMIVH